MADIESTAVARVRRDGATEALQAVVAALEAAVDLAQPHRTTGRCLTVAARVRVAADHPDRAGWLLDSLRQLAHEWETAR